MSGYRTLHRINTPSAASDGDDSPALPLPLWRLRFSPCAQRSASPQQQQHAQQQHRPLRLLVAGASSVVRAYSLTERTSKDAGTDDVLDASALKVECTHFLVGSDYEEDVDSAEDGSRLGCAALDIARNYVGDDVSAGDEIVAASQLGGKVSIWIRPDQHRVDTEDGSNDESRPMLVRPRAEFVVPCATGTTLAVRPPILGNYYSKRETDVLVALGGADGSVHLCRTSAAAARPGDNKGSVVGGGDHGNEKESVSDVSKAGQIVCSMGGGHACVTSLAFHPTIPNVIAVGRKDGTIDIYASPLDESNELHFRRIHRQAHSSSPIRALGYSQPDGALLFAGDDDGRLYAYDASTALKKWDPSAPVMLVSCALTAHKGWIMGLTALPDGHRVATCGSDGAVRVWDAGMGLASSTPVHSFEKAHEGLVWGVDCGGAGSHGAGAATGDRARVVERMKLASCGNDGVVQVSSCDE